MEPVGWTPDKTRFILSFFSSPDAPSEDDVCDAEEITENFRDGKEKKKKNATHPSTQPDETLDKMNVIPSLKRTTARRRTERKNNSKKSKPSSFSNAGVVVVQVREKKLKTFFV